MSGCDNLILIFEGKFDTKDFSVKNEALLRKQFISILVEQMGISKYSRLIQNEFKEINQGRAEKQTGDISLNMMTLAKDKKMRLRLIISEESNENQNENWEITTRNK